MNILEAIRTRRTIYRFRPERVSAEVVQRMIEAGTWAPNHRLTQPWRYTIVGQETQRAIAETFASAQAAEKSTKSSLTIDDVREKFLAKFMSKPNLIVISCQEVADPKQRREDLAAAACAVQNMQLAAWSEGVGCQWGTGAPTRHSAVLEILGITNDESVVAFLFFGYPEELPVAPARKAMAEVVCELP